MADVLLHPSFPDAEVARYKTRTRAGLMANRSQAAFLAQERLNQRRLRRPSVGRGSPRRRPSLDALTRDALVEFHQAHYVPNQAVLAISGDITVGAGKEKAEAALGSWQKAGAALAPPENPAPITGPSVSLIARPASVQTTLLVGTQSIERKDPDYDALDARQPHARRSGRAPLRAPARAEGLYLRREQRVQRGRFRGGWTARPMCAARSPIPR